MLAHSARTMACLLCASATLASAISASSEPMQQAKSILMRSQKDIRISADGEIIHDGAEVLARNGDARTVEVGPRGLESSVTQVRDLMSSLAMDVSSKSQPEAMPADSQGIGETRRRKHKIDIDEDDDEHDEDDDDDPDGDGDTPDGDDGDEIDEIDEDGDESDSATSPATESPDDDTEDGEKVPAPEKVHEKPTNSADFIPPPGSKWFPSPSPPPPPMSMEDLLGPQPSPSPFPEQPEEDPAICKKVHDIKVRDTRGTPNWAGVSVVRHGEKKTCSNAMFVGTFPNGRLEACAMMVARNDSCSNSFMLHKDHYDCSCVTSWEICKETDQIETCRYELNPGEFTDEEAGEAADQGDSDKAEHKHDHKHDHHDDDKHGHKHGHKRHGKGHKHE